MYFQLYQSVLLFYHRMKLQLLMLVFVCVVVMIQAKPFKQVRLDHLLNI